MRDYEIIDDMPLTSPFISKPGHEALQGFHVLVIQRHVGCSHVDLSIDYFDNTISELSLVDYNAIDAIVESICLGLEAGYIAAKSKKAEDIWPYLDSLDY